MIGILIGIAIRQLVRGPAAPPSVPHAPPALASEGGDRLLLESGGRLLME